MDFFSLPDVFLRQMMRTMEIKDRLNMRLTCRTFEELVANSHAGYFTSGRITRNYLDTQNKMLIQIDDQSFDNSTDYRSDKLLNLRNRLFNRITLHSFFIDCDFSLNFLRVFTERFEIEKLTLIVRSKTALENSRHLMSAHSSSKCTLELMFLPEFTEIVALPPMYRLSVWARSEVRFEETCQISTDTFFKLLNTHTNLYTKLVPIKPNDMLKTIKTITATDVQRTVQMLVVPSTIVNWLRFYGISEGSNPARYGEVELITPLKEEYDGSIQLRYRSCLIQMDGFSWIDSGFLVVVSFMNNRG
ncbi:hypothetical protein PMAYCL1PPCAC_21211 [Pristionchus mayeri]|uniref:F-box domain-containing protein n=1 Tax=Pristionchus mayeri TaxID=1317129 RepID=A0AAN5I530_9BILA|nr:hypothetical protein PMAYCL1PPCAC_21211 [Pristionchus mayeri]